MGQIVMMLSEYSSFIVLHAKHFKIMVPPHNEMKGKKKHAVNRIIIEKGTAVLISWKCDICSSVFGSFRQLKVHKIGIHTY